MAPLARGKAHEQAVAIATLGEGDRGALSAVARQLANPFPLVRFYAQRALATMGRPCAVDVQRPANEIAAAAASCFPALSAAGLRSPSPAPQPSGHQRRSSTTRTSRSLSTRRQGRRRPCILRRDPPVFWGSSVPGKTTTLTLYSPLQHRRRVGVNELEQMIDTRLVKGRSGDVLELAGGCVCHEVRVQSELWAAIEEVTRRSAPDVIVLETTGIAEPWSILDGLDELGPRAPAVAAGVVCVVDAEAGGGQLTRHEEARAQVEAAIDPADQARSREGRRNRRAPRRGAALRNPSAERASFSRRPTRRPRSSSPGCSTRAPAPAASGSHTSTPTPTPTASSPAVTYTDAGALLAEPLMAVLEGLGPALLRAKGFVHLAGEARRGFVERAGLQTALRLTEPWGAETPRNELVLIGEGLDAGAIHRQLWACRIGA